MKSKICLIYNYAQHYRLGIFKLLNDELEVDFYFGDKMDDVKKIDYSELSNFRNEVNNIKIFKNFYIQKGVIKLLFKNYDNYILLGEYYCLSTWLILILGKFTNKKIFLWTHGWYGKETVIQRIIKRKFFNLSDGIFLYGNYAKKLMIKEGFKESKLHVIYNSLNYDEQIEYRKKCVENDLYKSYFKNGYPTLVFIGRLTKVKKLNYIIEAISLLKNDNFNVNLAIIGNGENLNSLQELVFELDLTNRVWFVGSLYNENEISNFIYNSDLCVSPGNVGLTAMHAMMYGTPVITNSAFSYQMPEFEAIIKGVTGDFFEKDNVKDLAEKIKNWFNINLQRDKSRESCYNVIDSYYNPYIQLKTIKNAIETINKKEL